MKTVSVCLLITLLSLRLYSQPQDEAGWTVLDLARAEKVLYVSASAGDDATGTVYAAAAEAIGEDPLRPAGAIQPFRTIAGAAANVRNGEAAWILLKRGDTFYEGLSPRSGSTEQAPMVYSYYGSEGEPPLLKTGRRRAIDVCCDNFAHFWVVGLSFYAHTRNPDDADYVGPEGQEGMRLLAPPGVTLRNILIEGCTFRYYTNNVVQGKGTVARVALRRNGIFSNYSTTAHSQGLFSENLDGLVLEENTFDHNGWYRPSANADNSQAGGQATIFNHNAYLANMKNVRFEGNAFYRPSSIGTKWTANHGEASTSGIRITNNLYHDCEIAIEIGGNQRGPSYRFKDVEIVGNVVSSPGQSAPTKRVLGWGIDIDDWDDGQARDNLIVHQNRAAVANGRGIILRGKSRNTTISGNVLYDLMNTTGFRVETPDAGGVTVSDNVVHADRADAFLVESVTSLPTYPFRGNTYVTDGPTDQLFKIENRRLSLGDWRAITGETGLTTTAPAYPDPDRSVESYVTTVLQLPNMTSFYGELRKQTKLNWRTEYTAEAISAWIKQGFAMDTSDPAPDVTADSIVSIRAPATVVPGTDATLTVRYTASTERDVWAMLQPDSGPDFTPFRIVKQAVSAGTGSLTLDLPVPTDLPLAQDAYQMQVFITTREGNWDQRLDHQGQKDIDAVASSATRRTEADRLMITSETFTAYPNPASEVLIVEGSADYQISMYDPVGRTVVQQTHRRGTTPLDISRLRPGVYVLEVGDGIHPPLRRRVVVE